MQVSVLMSVYNSERFLKKAIDSVLYQSFNDFEFIIIDDGSTDNSLSILKSYSDPRIRIYSQENMGLNKGLAKTFNLGIEKCKGKYIARMDSDDICDPKRLELQYNYLERNHDVSVLGTGVWYIDANGVRLRKYLLCCNHKDIKSYLSQGKACIVHPSTMIRKNIFKKVGKYRFSTCEDFDLWFRISKISKIVNLPNLLYYYRVLPQQWTKNHLIQNYLIRKEIISDRNINPLFDQLDFNRKAIINSEDNKLLSKGYIKNAIEYFAIGSTKEGLDSLSEAKYHGEYKLSINVIRLFEKLNIQRVISRFILFIIGELSYSKSKYFGHLNSIFNNK